MKESYLIIQIGQYLNFLGEFFYRNNTGGMKASYTTKNQVTKKRFIKFGYPGAPDFVLVIQGRFIGIEAKSEKGEQSEKQKLFEQNLKKSGGEYWLITDIDQLQEKVRVFRKTLTT